EQTLMSEKWAPKALKGTLVGYDGHTIYQVYLKDQMKVIWVKDLCIFQDYESKFSTELPDYSEGTPTFQGFLLADNNDEQLEDLHLTRAGQKAKDAEKANHKGQKVEDAEFRAEDAMKKICTCHTIKLSAKAKDVKEVPSNPQKTFLLEQSSEIEKRKPLSPTEQSSEIEKRKPFSPTEHSLEI
ncbi:hypothetical protein MMC31_004629, partial [Peltigera leucophlebia]|nr:hypothetical protein [Peltigera leucophlebia]